MYLILNTDYLNACLKYHDDVIFCERLKKVRTYLIQFNFNSNTLKDWITFLLVYKNLPSEKRNANEIFQPGNRYKIITKTTYGVRYTYYILCTV